MSTATPSSLARRQSRLLAQVHKLAETPSFARLAEAEAAAAEFEEELEKLQSEISDSASSESFDPLSSPDHRDAISEEEFSVGQEISDQPPQPSPPPAPSSLPRTPLPPSPLLLDSSPPAAEKRPSFSLSVSRGDDGLEISSPSKRSSTVQTAQNFPIDRMVATEKPPRQVLTVVRTRTEISKLPETPQVDKKTILRSLNDDRRKRFWTSMEHFYKVAQSIIATGERMGKIQFGELPIYRPRKDFLFAPRRTKKKFSLVHMTSIVLIQRAFREHLQRMQSRKLLGAFSTLPDARSRARARARKQEISS